MIELVLAADIFLTVGGWSQHVKGGYNDCPRPMARTECKRQVIEYNNSHEALILEYEGFTVGTFKNSYGFRTNMIGYNYRWKDFGLGAYYGTGYRDNEHFEPCQTDLGKECLLISASYSFEPFKLSLMHDALALSFEFKLSSH